MKKSGYCFLIILVLLVGCARQVPVLRKLAPLPAKGVCKVALLPFLNESKYPQGDAIVHKVLLSELVAAGHFQVIQEGDIRDLYHQLLLFPDQMPDPNQLKMIGGRLNSDLFVCGTIQKMSENRVGSEVNTEITLFLKLYDGISGQLLWTTYHRRTGSEYQQIMHLGRINTVTGLALRMSREIITDWIQQGMTPCAK